MELKEEEHDFQVVLDDPEPDFAALAAVTLDNAGIVPQDRHRAAQQSQQLAANPATPTGPTMIEADEDKIVYEITFDLFNASIGTGIVILLDANHPAAVVTFAPTTDAIPDDKWQSPT